MNLSTAALSLYTFLWWRIVLVPVAVTGGPTAHVDAHDGAVVMHDAW